MSREDTGTQSGIRPTRPVRRKQEVLDDRGSHVQRDKHKLGGLNIGRTHSRERLALSIFVRVGHECGSSDNISHADIIVPPDGPMKKLYNNSL